MMTLRSVLADFLDGVVEVAEEWWKNREVRRRKAVRAYFIINNKLYQGGSMYQMGADLQVHATVVFTDKKGNVAQVQGVPFWENSNTQVANLVPDADGMGALIVGGVLGTCQIKCRGDADLGDGFEPVDLLLDVEIVAGKAASGSINPGTPEPQP